MLGLASVTSLLAWQLVTTWQVFDSHALLVDLASYRLTEGENMFERVL
jgi:hypothetical protein